MSVSRDSNKTIQKLSVPIDMAHPVTMRMTYGMEGLRVTYENVFSVSTHMHTVLEMFTLTKCIDIVSEYC